VRSTSIRRTGWVVSAKAGMIAPRKKIAVKPMKDQPLLPLRMRKAAMDLLVCRFSLKVSF